MTDVSSSGTAGDRGPREIDQLTVLGIAVVAYCITVLIHEGVGHGGACILAGGRPTVLNAIYFSCDDSSMAISGKRALAAGGSVANVALALIAWTAMRMRQNKLGAFHYFLWLLFALNLLMPFGYFLFSGVAGFGDWAAFVEGLRPAWLFRVIVAAVGGVLYFSVAPRLLMPGLNLYLGRDQKRRQLRAKQVGLFPYLAGGITFVAAGLLNPVSLMLVLLSAAAASFGGTCWLAYYPGGSEDEKRFRSDAPEEPAGIPRHVGWIAAGVVVLAVFVGVLGRGITLR
jgi:hypothetical protein